MAENIVTKTGPIFDGRAIAALHDYIGDLKVTLAEKGVQIAVGFLGGSERVDEGKYNSSIHVDQDSQYAYVHDLMTFVYGPWLEGDGSRNG